MATLEDCLRLPGSSFPVGLNPSSSRSSHPLGNQLLEQARARSNGHPLPSQLIAAPGLVSGLYDEVRGQLPVDFHQPASASLNAAVVTKNTYPSRTDGHEDEASVVKMDELDIVNVALEGADCVNTALGDDRNLLAKSRSAGDKIDLAITATNPRTRESTSLLVFEHKSLSVGRSLEDFRLAEQLAREHQALDYRSSPSSRRRPPARLARRIRGLFSQAQLRAELSPNELKMKTILERTVLYLIRAECRFAVISDHEHWLFLEVMDRDAVAVSPVYPVTTTAPTLIQTVFAILCDRLGHAAISSTDVRVNFGLPAAAGSAGPGGTISGLAAIGEQPLAERGEGSHTESRRPAERSEETHPESDWLDLFDAARPSDGLVVVADSLRDPAWSQPPKQLACTAVSSVLLLLPHVPASQILQPSPVSSVSSKSRSADVSDTHTGPDTSASLTSTDATDESSHSDAPISYLPLERAFAGGSTATTYKIHGLDLVCKLFGPTEGSQEDRCDEDWLGDFELEAYAYYRLLPALQGSAIPKCYGAFRDPDEPFAALILQYCGVPVSHASQSHEKFRREDAESIMALANQLGNLQFCHEDFSPRNVLRSEDGSLRIIDLARFSLAESEEAKDEWLSEIQDLVED